MLFKNLLEQYQAATTVQRWTQIEAELWNLRPTDLNVKERHTREHWLVSILPGKVSHSDIGRRQRLLHAPQELWNLVDLKQVTVGAAVDLWAAAKKVANSGDELNRLLAERETTHKKVVINGKTTTRQTYNNRARKSVVGKTDPSKLDTTKKVWFAIRGNIQQMIEVVTKSHNIDEISKRNLTNQLDRELATLVVGFQQSLARYKKGVVKATRGQMINACHTLRMEPPLIGQPPSRKMIMKNYRALLPQYHPDTSRVENAAGKLKAVSDAKNIAIQYVNEWEKEHESNE
jgi:hypothetical protein